MSTSNDNKETLELAISKAIDGGWKVDYDKDFILAEMLDGEFGYDIYNIFNHNFARAIWKKPYEPDFYHLRGTKSGRKGHGSVEVLSDVTGEKWVTEWQYHLQNMVISPDPLIYLKEHLDD